jgi:phage baseplate assembly protein W
MAISFKSVGQTKEQRSATPSVVTKDPPVGIKTPLQISTDEGLLTMNYNLPDQLADNLRNLLQTNWGERVGQYYFGANLRPLTTEYVNQENFDTEAISRIRDAVATWMPFIELEDFTSEVDRTENTSTGIIRVTITYNVPAFNIRGKSIQVVLYIL